MAQMPRGEPRSVPDPDGELYDEMIRQERRKKALAEAGVTMRGLRNPDLTLQFNKPASDPIATVDGRQIDTRCIVGGRQPASAAELAERRAAIDRVSYMSGNPLAGAAYGIAALSGASPQARDAAMLAGGAADALMTGAAPRGAAIARRPAPPQAGVAPLPFERDPIRLRERNELGQATGVTASLTQPMLGAGTRPDRRIKPPGWQGHGRQFNEARAHLLANQLGGLGGDARNLMTLTQKGANQPQMRNFEDDVARRVRAGEVVEYSSTPLYNPGVLPPWAVLLTATGSRGAPTARLVANPAGRPR